MKNADYPAMPQSVTHAPNGDTFSSDDFDGGAGLTKREYFAALAMQGLVAGRAVDFEGQYIEELAYEAKAIANQLLKELEK